MAKRKRKFSLRRKFRKWFDRALDNSFGVQFVALLMLTILIAAAGTALAHLLIADDFSEASWWAWIRVVDPGQLGGDGEEGWQVIALSATVVFCGWVVFGLLISILTTAFQERLASIKSGTTEILSSDHTIVLGWNSTVFSVIDQLGSDDEEIASEVVVLAELEVSHMKAEAEKYCRPSALKDVSFRSGSIASVNTIKSLKIADARQVIVLGFDKDANESGPSDEEAADPISSSVLKALLACYQAVSSGKKTSRHADRLPIVASVSSALAARAIERGVPRSVGGRLSVHVVHTTDLLSRLTAQIANEPSLSRVYSELFSYEGSIVDGVDISSEIYVVDIAVGMAGKTFDDCLMGYKRAVPIGFVTGERTVINPMPGSDEAMRVFLAGDRIVAIADTKEDIVWSGPEVMVESSTTLQGKSRAPKRLLVLGDGLKPRRILKYLPGYLPEGSTIFTNQSTEGLDAGTSSYERFVNNASSESGVGSLADKDLVSFDCVVLADDIADPDLHDAKVLMDLTMIHAAANGREIMSTAVVELLDYRNVELARAFGQMAAIVSSELVSNFLVQLAVEPDRGAVFRELLDPEGCEIHVRLVTNYVTAPDEKVSFDELFVRARSRGDILVGYIPAGDTPLQLSPRDRSTSRSAQDFNELVVVCEE